MGKPVKVDAAALAVIRSLPVRHRELGPEWRGSLAAAVKERRNGGGQHNSYLKRRTSILATTAANEYLVADMAVDNDKAKAW